jgi:uncharacterized protein
MKKILIIIFLFFALPAFAYYNPGSPSGFVNDFAGMMSESEITSLESKISAFEEETSNEISVVTISSLEEDYIENFAVRLFEEWGIGKKDKNNGVLILVAKEDREMRIEVGYGLEGALTDSQSFWIIEKVMKPEFREEKYYNGIDGAVDNIIKAVRGEYVPSETSSGSGSVNYGDLFYFVIFGVLWLVSILGRSKSWWAGGVVGGIIGIIIGIIKGFLFFGLIAIAVLIPFGLFFDFVVSKSYQKGKAKGHIPWWIGGGRGGSGGGFGGGGFGGFGGGMSGGGGASGRW